MADPARWLRNARRRARRLAHAAAVVVLSGTALLTGGCQVLSYTGPNGEHFSRACLGTKSSLASLTVEAGTNGIRRVDLRGYQNDSTQALGTVTEAAVKAALQSK